MREVFVLTLNSSPRLSTSVDRTERMGSPRYIITETQIRMLREEGFRWVDVARIQGVSPITLRRRRRTEFEMPVSDNFDDIPGDVLDNLVSGILHVQYSSGGPSVTILKEESTFGIH